MRPGGAPILAAAAALLSSPSPAAAQEVRQRNVSYASFESRRPFPWPGLLDATGALGPKTAERETKRPAAAVFLGDDGRFLLADFALAPGPREEIEEPTTDKAAIEIERERTQLRTLEALQRAIKAGSARAAAIEEIRSPSPMVARALSWVADRPKCEMMADLYEKAVKTETYKRGFPPGKQAEYRKLLGSSGKLWKSFKTTLTDAQRKDVERIALDVKGRPYRATSLEALRKLLEPHQGTRTCVALCVALEVGLPLEAGLRIRAALDGFDVVYGIGEGEATKPRDGPLCVSLPFELLDAAAWQAGTGKILEGRWSGRTRPTAGAEVPLDKPLYALDGAAATEQGLDGLATLLGEGQPGATLAEVRLDLKLPFTWSECLRVVALARTLGCRKVSLRGTG